MERCIELTFLFFRFVFFYFFPRYRAAKEAGATRFGIHMMTGSCVMKSTYWEETVASMFDTLNAISTELGIEFEFVNVGGGLGIPYKPDEVRALPCAAA